MLGALDQWVEKGKAPDQIPASRVKDGVTDRTRPLCPYPQVATTRAAAASTRPRTSSARGADLGVGPGAQGVVESGLDRLARCFVQHVTGRVFRVAGGAVVSVGLVMSALLAVSAQRYIPAEVEAGGRLFQSSCTGCHGPEGDWVGGVNFSKGQFRRSTSDDDLVRVIMRGIPNTPMPPSNFSDGQAATIVAYVRSLAASGGGVGPRRRRSRQVGVRRQRPVPDLPQRQRDRLAHRAGADRNRLVPSRRRAAALASRSRRGDSAREPRRPRGHRAMAPPITGGCSIRTPSRCNCSMRNERLLLFEKSSLREYHVLKSSPMPSYRDKLNAQELADVVSYLASLRGRP